MNNCDLLAAQVLVHCQFDLLGTIPKFPKISQKFKTHTQEHANTPALIMPEDSAVCLIFLHEKTAFVKHQQFENQVFTLNPKYLILRALLPPNTSLLCLCWPSSDKTELEIGIYDILSLAGNSLKHLDVLQRHHILHSTISENHTKAQFHDDYINQQKFGRCSVHWLGYESACVKIMQNSHLQQLPFRPNSILRIEEEEYCKVLLPLNIPVQEKTVAVQKNI